MRRRRRKRRRRRGRSRKSRSSSRKKPDRREPDKESTSEEEREHTTPDEPSDGTLKEMLGIDEHETIYKSILRRIKNAKIGNNIKLPTTQGKDRVTVTEEMKQKTMAVWNRHYAEDDSDVERTRPSGL